MDDVKLISKMNGLLEVKKSHLAFTLPGLKCSKSLFPLDDSICISQVSSLPVIENYLCERIN